MLRTVKATRYVLALREGGSLPAIVEADDLGTYVLKFRGSGHGSLALVAELVAGEIGRTLGLKVPELVFIEVDPALGRSDPDAEIRHLLQASVGQNLALDFLPPPLFAASRWRLTKILTLPSPVTPPPSIRLSFTFLTVLMEKRHKWLSLAPRTMAWVLFNLR